MRLLYGPTLFEASRMAADQLHALARRMNLLSLPDALKLAHSNLQSIICKALRWANFVLVNWLELAYNKVQHKTAVWAGWLPISFSHWPME